jgi:hypothetical protein
MSDLHHPAWIEESRFRGALDDVIIVPLVLVALAANKIIRFVLSVLMRLLDPSGDADCLASAVRGQGPWQCRCYCRKRRVALPSPFRDETSAVEDIDPPELVMASAED